jgi:hypothetical protein
LIVESTPPTAMAPASVGRSSIPNFDVSRFELSKAIERLGRFKRVSVCISAKRLSYLISAIIHL